MEIGMSQKELERVEVLALRRSGRIEQAEAARRLGLSVRQIRRLEARVEQGGAQALRSRRRRQPSNHRTSAAVCAQAISLIGELYRDFGPTLAAEYLAREQGVILSKETVRRLMTEARLWRPKRGPAARIYAQRERRACFGELIQVDGSWHPWFEARAPSCCLLVFIDDATSRLTACTSCLASAPSATCRRCTGIFSSTDCRGRCTAIAMASSRSTTAPISTPPSPSLVEP